MSNTIRFKNMTCRCSNGCLDVLLTVIGLSGSKIARSDCERNMIIWLMEKDQSMVGLGTVLFDIIEMPWKKQCFERQKLFMLQVLAGVKEKTGWETLDYDPNEEIIFDRINSLQDMFYSIQVNDINEELTDQWLEDAEICKLIGDGYPKCKKHGIYMSIWGCLACNDT